ncbi:uncharacterized protein KRP23_1737 [Phytophthora ramorum]|uniref:uncharacterized protein n=1 Tax=Phytophthora ramorum TaxID=164328 RepID=UPI0030A7FCFE|nr:hypothetical protein KRP23_1737 [Phytophthora ramorum]
MLVRRERYKKVDVEEALDRAYEGEKFAAVARPLVPLHTLFKKSKELQTTGAITKNVEDPSQHCRQSKKPTSSPGLQACSVQAFLSEQSGSLSARTTSTRSSMVQ